MKGMPGISCIFRIQKQSRGLGNVEFEGGDMCLQTNPVTYD